MILSIFYGCGKCSNKPVGSPFCEEGFYQWQEAEIIERTSGFNFIHSPYVIRTQSEYDSLYPNTKPIEVDFDTHTLLGLGGGGQGQDLSSISWVCRNSEADIVKMYAQYSLENQCAGSGIYSIPYAYWAVIPQISDETEVKFETINVNPFD